MRPKRTKRKQALWTLAALLLASCGGGDRPSEDASSETPPPEDPLAGLVEADRAFGRMSAEEGPEAAFRTWLAPDGILFRPGPVRADEWLAENPEGPASLRWVPTGAGLAASGDLGYTTGPYIATDASGEESHGHYLSIWATDPEGGFDVVLDTGTPGPDAGPLPKSPEVEDPFEGAAVAAGAPSPEPTREALEALMGVDRGYAVVQATEGTVAALQTHAARSVGIQRPGSAPLLGLEATEADPMRAGERISTSPVDGRVSASGTLGYVYGSVARDGRADAGNYVRIWRRDPGAPWALAFELVDLAPE